MEPVRHIRHILWAYVETRGIMVLCGQDDVYLRHASTRAPPDYDWSAWSGYPTCDACILLDMEDPSNTDFLIGSEEQERHKQSIVERKYVSAGYHRRGI